MLFRRTPTCLPVTTTADLPQQVSLTVILSQASSNMRMTVLNTVKRSKNMMANNAGSSEKLLERKGKKLLSLAKDKIWHCLATHTSSPELREAKQGFV